MPMTTQQYSELHRGYCLPDASDQLHSTAVLPVPYTVVTAGNAADAATDLCNTDSLLMSAPGHALDC